MVFEWRKPLGVAGKPYAYRWRSDFYWFSFRIHKWICSDDERAYHSHPTNMYIYILKGSYVDVSIDREGKVWEEPFLAGMTRVIRRNTRHFIHITKSPTWTLVFTWGAPEKWAFWDKFTLKRKNRDKYFKEHGNHICEH